MDYIKEVFFSWAFPVTAVSKTKLSNKKRRDESKRSSPININVLYNFSIAIVNKKRIRIQTCTVGNLINNHDYFIGFQISQFV